MGAKSVRQGHTLPRYMTQRGVMRRTTRSLPTKQKCKWRISLSTVRPLVYPYGSLRRRFECQRRHTGTKFYVYGVLSQSKVQPLSTADISFFIDGQPAGYFKYIPPNIPNSYVYNSLLWHSDTLPLGQHTFSLQNGRPGGNLSLILLDYVVYTR